MNYSIDQIFEEAIRKGASDVHIVAGMPPVFRINGALISQKDMGELTPTQTAQLCSSMISGTQKQIFDKTRELDFSYLLPDGVRARVNISWELGTAGLVGRIIPAQIPNLEYVMMGETVKQILQARQGLILLTGSSGVGKTTSLAAMIDYINTERAEHIVTLEDPIEFVHTPKRSIIRQRELNSDMLSFASALRHVVRQDPDVILVGEMRDLETIAATISLAETGHLVLASLHTIDVEQTIDRILDFFPSHQQQQVRTQLSLFLKAIIAKQLVPRVSGGRIPLYEILLNTTATSNLIRDNKLNQIKTVMETSRKLGMVTMEQEVERLRKSGEISAETVQTYFPEFLAR